MEILAAILFLPRSMSRDDFKILQMKGNFYEKNDEQNNLIFFALACIPIGV